MRVTQLLYSLRQHSSPLAVLLAIVGLGCSEERSSTDPTVHPVSDRSPISQISGDDLAAAVSESPVPVVVEFSVPVGCFRCNDTRPQFERLAGSFADRAKFVRVDFNQSSALAASLGATVCPSYVLFDRDGVPAACIRYPTSGDLIAAEIEATLGSQP